MEESLRKMQVIASKSESSSGQVASRKKKLNRLGVEKNEKGIHKPSLYSTIILMSHFFFFVLFFCRTSV